MITAPALYDLPAHIDREACRQHFRKLAPDFLGVLGFIRKQFILDVNGGVAGGSYIWTSLAAAKAFYNRRRGSEPTDFGLHMRAETTGLCWPDVSWKVILCGRRPASPCHACWG